MRWTANIVTVVLLIAVAANLIAEHGLVPGLLTFIIGIPLAALSALGQPEVLVVIVVALVVGASSALLSRRGPPRADAVLSQAPPSRTTGTAGWAASPPATDWRRQVTLPRVLAVTLGVGGPPAAFLYLATGSLEPPIAILVGSFGAAGLLYAADGRGVRGALVALLVPVAWAVLAIVLMATSFDEGSLTDEQHEFTAAIGAALLMAVASTEAGYLVGRFAARLNRTRTAPTT